MSFFIDYKSVIKSNVPLAGVEEILNNFIAPFGVYDFQVSQPKVGELQLSISGDSSQSRFDQLLQGLGEVYKRHDMNGSYLINIDGEKSDSGFFGANGKSVRAEQLNREIAEKLAELNKLEGFGMPDVSGVAVPGFNFGSSVMEFVALRTSQNYDPNVSALLALQDKARQAMTTMSQSFDYLLKGKLNPSQVSTVFNSEIESFNAEVDDVIKVSVVKNAKKPKF